MTPIKLDKMRNLFYGMGAIKLIENTVGKPLAEIPQGSKMTAEHKAIFLWAGLCHEDDQLTPEKVIELVDEYSNYFEAIETMNRAILESYGKNSARAAAKEHGTGKN
jgi:hypothetical protein